MDSQIYDFDYEPTYEELYGNYIEPEAKFKYGTGVISELQKYVEENENSWFDCLEIDMNKHEEKQQNQQEEEPFFDIESDDEQHGRNLMADEEPLQPQEPEQDLNNAELLGSVQNTQSHLFNNFPGFKQGTIISLKKDIKPSEELIGDNTNIPAFLQLFFLLKEALMIISTKNGNRTQHRAILNDIDWKIIHEIENKVKKSKAQKKYLELLKKFKGQQDLINEAKYHLRLSLGNLMTAERIHNHCQKRQFKTESDFKKIIFEKYLNYFRYELLEENELKVAVIRQDVLKMPLFQK